MHRVTAYVLAGLLFATPAAANQDGPMKEFEDAARDAATRIVEALSSIISAIPQYEAPEILDNGDIIIRRKQKPDADEDTATPKVKNTSAETAL